MSSKFCYDHNKMALRVGNDYYGKPIFYCSLGEHYILDDNETKRFVNIFPAKSIDEIIENTDKFKKD